jgi:hypothetical protein
VYPVANKPMPPTAMKKLAVQAILMDYELGWVVGRKA